MNVADATFISSCLRCQIKSNHRLYLNAFAVCTARCTSPAFASATSVDPLLLLIMNRKLSFLLLVAVAIAIVCVAMSVEANDALVLGKKIVKSVKNLPHKTGELYDKLTTPEFKAPPRYW